MTRNKAFDAQFQYDCESLPLSQKDKVFVQLYHRAWILQDRRASQELATQRFPFERLVKAAEGDRNSRLRDIMNTWRDDRSVVKGDECGRCLKTMEDCNCVAYQRGSHYSENDWRASMNFTLTEQTLVEYMDTHKKAVDFLPYGDAPDDLLPGATVRVCLPNHSLQGMIGTVTALRLADGKYSVTVFKGRDVYQTYLNPNEISIARTR